MSDRRRVDREPAFVLHSYAYSETSLLVEAFSRRHGRLPLLAKGARRPGSALRAAVMAFQPLSLAWSGRGEVRTLARCEWQGGQPMLRGERLLCGFYLNELLLRLLPREDPHEQLFDRYAEAVRGLATDAESGAVLRAFERRLLQELGYALTLDRDASSGAPIDASRSYRYDPERGPVALAPGGAPPRGAVSGEVLLALARDDYGDPALAQGAKQLMRALIDHRLERQPLHSRTIFQALLNL